MKLVVLISAYHKLVLLDPIVKRLKSFNLDVYLQLDAKCNEIPSKYVLDNVKLLKPLRRAGWGAWTVIDNILNGYKEILERDSDVTNIWLCSGEDLIIRKPIIDENKNYINNVVSANNAVIHVANVNEGDSFPIQAASKFEISKLDLPLADVREFYRGQTWTILKRSSIINILKYWNSHLKFWKIRGLDEELVPATYCMNFEPESVENVNWVFQEYNSSGCHPKQLSVTEFDTIYNSNAIVARKCSSVKNQLLWLRFIEDK